MGVCTERVGGVVMSWKEPGGSLQRRTEGHMESPGKLSKAGLSPKARFQEIEAKGEGLHFWSCLMHSGQITRNRKSIARY